MTKETVSELRALEKEIVEIHLKLEGKTAEFKKKFSDATGLETDKPINLTKILEILEKAVA